MFAKVQSIIFCADMIHITDHSVSKLDILRANGLNFGQLIGHKI